MRPLLLAASAVVLLPLVGLFSGCESAPPGHASSMPWNAPSVGGAAAAPPPSPPAMVLAGVAPARERSPAPEFSTETYADRVENAFKSAKREPLSTFSIDVDTASYANLRRFVRENERPPVGAIRVEELVNYFDYNYPGPEGDDPFGVYTEVAACPWNPRHRLALIGLRARDIPPVRRPPANLVFLLDVSGSMDDPQKLPLVQKSMRLLVDQLQARDHVAVVTYAGEDKIALPPTACSRKDRIIAALDELNADGSTHASAGIKTAYDLARKQFRQDGINRVILATDGDFNVGITNESELTRLIATEAQSGVFLTALGFGMGNLKDSTLQKLAQNGNGQHAYIDSELEARKVLVSELGATLQTVAKDVKVQIEFNPAAVQAYRLIGYENRLLAAADFADDKKDAGDMGAGHRVTALYELVPPGLPDPTSPVDDLQYQTAATVRGASNDLFTLKIRHKAPRGTRSQLRTRPVTDSGRSFAQASSDFRFASAVAALGLLLTDSAYRGDASRSKVLTWAGAAANPDPSGLRRDFLALARKAKFAKAE